MGRARITLRHILNERIRKTTLMRRKRGLMKKISEFSSKCGGEHCLIVYDDGNGDAGAVTLPPNPVEVHSIIQKYYEIQLKNGRPHKTYGIKEFFDNRKNTIEAEISKVHKEISRIKYPAWDPSLINMEEDQLRAFCDHVDAKIRACDQKIKFLKNKPQSEANSCFLQTMNQASTSFSQPNLPNFMQNLSQDQIITTPIPTLNNGWVDFTNPVNQVDGATNQLSDSEFEKFMMELSNCDCSYQACDDPAGCSSQPDESVLYNISAEYQNVLQGGGALHTFPPPLDGFQTNFYV